MEITNAKPTTYKISSATFHKAISVDNKNDLNLFGGFKNMVHVQLPSTWQRRWLVIFLNQAPLKQNTKSGSIFHIVKMPVFHELKL